jgi:hypothetical protein
MPASQPASGACCCCIILCAGTPCSTWLHAMPARIGSCNHQEGTLPSLVEWHFPSHHGQGLLRCAGLIATLLVHMPHSAPMCHTAAGAAHVLP